MARTESINHQGSSRYYIAGFNETGPTILRRVPEQSLRPIPEDCSQHSRNPILSTVYPSFIGGSSIRSHDLWTTQRSLAITAADPFPSPVIMKHLSL